MNPDYKLIDAQVPFFPQLSLHLIYRDADIGKAPASPWTYHIKQPITQVQDFLIKLGIKPHLRILKISIFSLNHVIIRPTKIMKKLLKVCKINRVFLIFFENFDFKSILFLKMCPIFVCSVHNFGKSDDDII